MVRDSMQAGHSLIYTRRPAHSAVAGTWERCYEDGSFLWFVDANHTPDNLRTVIGNMLNMVVFTTSTTNTALSRKFVGGAIDSICLIPSRMGIVIISGAATIVDGSLVVPSAYSGQRMLITIRGGTHTGNNGSITLAFSDCDQGGLVGVNCFDDSMGISLSSIVFWASASTQPWVMLVSPNGDDWSVLDYGSGSVDGDNPRNHVVGLQAE